MARCVTPSPASSVERAVQLDRIGRGQRAVDLARRRHQADGADAGGLLAERRPDLAGEGGDRGLAAGAGDRRDRLAAGAEKNLAAASASARRASATLTNATPAGSGAGGTRSAMTAAAPAASAWPTKRKPIGLGAGHRDEQVAGLDLAAVGA